MLGANVVDSSLNYHSLELVGVDKHFMHFVQIEVFVRIQLLVDAVEYVVEVPTEGGDVKLEREEDRQAG